MKTKSISGRRNCGKCKRWRSILDFRVQKWEEGKLTPRHLNSYCNLCHRTDVLEYQKRHVRATRRDKRRAWRRKNWGTTSKNQHKHGKLVPVRPLQEWMRTKNLFLLARAAGMHESRLYQIQNGFTIKHGKKYEIKNVSIGVVDKLLHADGENLTVHDLYSNV